LIKIGLGEMMIIQIARKGFGQALLAFVFHALVFTALAPLAKADPVEDFYKGRQIKAIVGNPPGSDYDVWMRLMVRHWGRFIPGKPSFIVQNMPGAGQIIAANYIANSAERDGSVIGFTERALPYLSLMGDSNIRFDPRKLSWIGSPELTNRACFAIETSPVQKAEELFEKEILIGGAGAGTSVTNTPILLAKLLGMKFKLIEGYGSAENVIHAMEKGELNSVCQTIGGIRSSRPGWIESGKLKVLFTMEHDPVPGINAPTIYQFAKTEEQKQIISLYDSSLELGRPVIGPPGIPADRLEALRRSFDAMMADPAFLEDAKKLHYEITLRKGEKLQQVVDEIMSAPPSVIERIKELTK
jgi:tripartite-type tricarboxylate transporter receptor subunit TctC